jgi:Transcriptional regulator, AbiEi antitoxin
VSSETPRRLQELAGAQGGVVSRSQALKSGMSVGEIDARVKFGRWRPLHRGVYATFTGPLRRDVQLWAAVLYAGQGARLSHESAAEILGLTSGQLPHIQVSISPERRVVPVDGLIIHISSYNGQIWRPPPGVPPHTSEEDTVLDLVHAATSLDDVIGWVTRAMAKPLTSDDHLRRAMAARKQLRWRHELNEIITAAVGGAHSVLEYRHDRDVQRAHGLPPAKKQVPFKKPDGTNGYLDRYYPEHGLIIELDGKQYHPDERRGQDQDRDNTNAVTGSTLRYGWDDVTRRACQTARQEADALRSRGWRGTPKPCSPTCWATYSARPATPAPWSA